MKSKSKPPLKKKAETKTTPVIIFGPSASGTSLLAHTCRLCGMYTGLEDDDTHLERQDVADMLNKGELNRVEDVIQGFAGVAELRNYPVYGMKLTCFGIDKWKLLKPYFDKYWIGAVKLAPFRHPYGYFLSQCAKKPDRSPDPGIDHVINNWLGFWETWKYLINKEGFRLVEFPLAWDSGQIKDVIIESGLEWNDVVISSLYEAENANHINENELEIFSKRFEKATSKYYRLVTASRS